MSFPPCPGSITTMKSLPCIGMMQHNRNSINMEMLFRILIIVAKIRIMWQFGVDKVDFLNINGDINNFM